MRINDKSDLASRFFGYPLSLYTFIPLFNLLT